MAVAGPLSLVLCIKPRLGLVASIQAMSSLLRTEGGVSTGEFQLSELSG